MTDQEIKQLIDAGVDRNKIEFIIRHDEIGEAFQDQLLALLEAGDYTKYQDCLEELMLWKIWDDSKDGPEDLTPGSDERVHPHHHREVMALPVSLRIRSLGRLFCSL